MAYYMIFLSVVWGIYSIGDAATFSEIGKRLGLDGAFISCAHRHAGAQGEEHQQQNQTNPQQFSRCFHMDAPLSCFPVV